MEEPTAAGQSWLRRSLADLLLVGLLLGLGWKVGYEVSTVRDLSSADEATYMWLGARIPEHGLPRADGCPLYCLWYHALSRLQPNPARLCYLSWQLLLSLLSVGVYLLARCAGARRAVSLLAGFLVLNSWVQDIWSYPSYLAAILLLLGTAAASRCRTWPWSLAVMGLALLLAGYARPECAVAFLLFCPVATAGLARVALQGRATWRQTAVPALVVLLAVAACVKWAGNPLGGGRSFEAFAQHYAFNLASAHKLPRERVLSHEPEIARATFGSASTVGQALKANPAALLWHLKTNLRILPFAFKGMMEPKLELSPGKQRIVSWGLRILLVLGSVGMVRRCSLSAQSAAGQRGFLLGIFLLGCLSVPTLAACLVVFPQGHYLAPAAVLLFGLSLSSLAHCPRVRIAQARADSAPALLLLAALVTATTPNLAHGWSVQSLGRNRPAPPLLPNQQCVRALRALNLKGSGVALGSFVNLVYAGLPPRFVDVRTKDVNFRDFVRRGNIGIVFLDDWLLNDVAYRNDPEFKDFAEEKWVDFIYVSVPRLPLRIAVRKDLLPRPRSAAPEGPVD